MIERLSIARRPQLADVFARPNPRRRVLLALLSVLCCLAGAAVAQASFPGRPGHLVLSAETTLLNGTEAGGQNALLWDYDPRTRTPRRLTSRGRGCGWEGHWEDGGPAYSPDGRRIAYLHSGCGPQWELRIMRADGSANRRVAALPYVDPVYDHVAFSADSRRIAVGPRVFEVATGIATERSVPGESSSRLDWSAAGRLASVAGLDINGRIFTTWPDGTGIRWVTSVQRRGPLTSSDQSPDWSPNARSIVFERHWWNFGRYCGEDGCGSPDRSGIWKVSPGTAAVQLRSIPAGSDAQPTFSPSGREIAFMNEDEDMILAMAANGKGPTRPLVRHPRIAGLWSFDWQPRPRR